MQNDQIVCFLVLFGTSILTRSHTEWVDDNLDWCAQGRTKWNQIIKKHQTPVDAEPVYDDDDAEPK